MTFLGNQFHVRVERRLGLLRTNNTSLTLLDVESCSECFPVRRAELRSLGKVGKVAAAATEEVYRVLLGELQARTPHITEGTS